METGAWLVSTILPDQPMLGLASKVVDKFLPDLSQKVKHAKDIGELMTRVGLLSGGEMESSALCHSEAIKCLHDLLEIYCRAQHQRAFKGLVDVRYLSKLQPATTEEGHWIWAGSEEIASMNSPLTAIDPADERCMSDEEPCPGVSISATLLPGTSG